MQQDDDRPVSRALIDDIEHKLTAAVLVHALSMPPTCPGHSAFAVAASATRLPVVGWRSPYGGEDWATCDRQLTYLLKAVAFVSPPILRTRRFKIGRYPITDHDTPDGDLRGLPPKIFDHPGPDSRRGSHDFFSS